MGVGADIVVDHGVGSVVGIQLAQDSTNMILNRLLADLKNTSDLLV